MSDSTSILDLPTDPAGGSGNNNVNIKANEMAIPQTGTLDQMTINQIVSGLQQASSSGATQLPSRDIAMTTNNITQDPHIQPNYIPPPPILQNTRQNVDYINSNEHSNDIINNYNSNKQHSDSLDDMYNEIQTPLLLATLYFLFQLPFFRKHLLSYLPFLFSMDGNLNINGYLFMSALFGVLYYFLNKITTKFNAF